MSYELKAFPCGAPAQDRQAVKDEILDSLKLKNKPAYDMFEFEYKRALDEADKLGKLRV